MKKEEEQERGLKISDEVREKLKKAQAEIKKEQLARFSSNLPLAQRLNNWLMILFSKRQLCYVYFHYTEKGVDLKAPRKQMEPYIAWVHPEANIKSVAPLFEGKIKKSRNIQLTNIQIIPVPNVAVI